jgi:hypothetical protein
VRDWRVAFATSIGAILVVFSALFMVAGATNDHQSRSGFPFYYKKEPRIPAAAPDSINYTTFATVPVQVSHEVHPTQLEWMTVVDQETGRSFRCLNYATVSAVSSPWCYEVAK